MAEAGWDEGGLATESPLHHRPPPSPVSGSCAATGGAILCRPPARGCRSPRRRAEILSWRERGGGGRGACGIVVACGGGSHGAGERGGDTDGVD